MRHFLTFIVLIVTMSPASTDTTQGEQRRDWFRSLKQPNTGTTCCDLSDCHDTVAIFRNGHWFARNRHHVLVPIPPEKVLTEPKSIDGEAYLCESNSEPATIYCFIPPIPGF